MVTSATPSFQAAGNSVLWGEPKKGENWHLSTLDFVSWAGARLALLLSIIITQKPVSAGRSSWCSVASKALGRLPRQWIRQSPRRQTCATTQPSITSASKHSTVTEFIEFLPVRHCASTWDVRNKRQSLSQRNSELNGKRDKKMNNCWVSETHALAFHMHDFCHFLVTAYD